MGKRMIFKVNLREVKTEWKKPATGHSGYTEKNAEPKYSTNEVIRI
jgi:hypothetical protein